ncbi:hypothetical protein P873_05155 [Arenimonas composti TR7-09 = DSM 18010]|uniref:Uncharacterized protein n=1 Tax=Arenimonas composti TR7-09 = DSM 18010 TaxID=1121013 RepID=A0A091BJ14_9GAMM|nr:hypothetical protein P873_05155 [Arenimonas composti TR7-09 = DSM 18010]
MDELVQVHLTQDFPERVGWEWARRAIARVADPD